MDADLSTLEDRVRQAVDLCQRLRAENNDLRQRVAQLQTENRRLVDKISGARERLAGLLSQIPE